MSCMACGTACDAGASIHDANCARSGANLDADGAAAAVVSVAAVAAAEEEEEEVSEGGMVVVSVRTPTRRTGQSLPNNAINSGACGRGIEARREG